MSLLEVIKITKSFGGLKAVSEISLNVEQGQIVSVIGPNGAGKTTVFNLLTGFYPCDSGSIKLNGKEISNLPPSSYIKNKVARTFQNLRVFPTMTVLENVLIGYQSKITYNWFDAVFKTTRYKKEELAAVGDAKKLLDDMGLFEYADEKCMNLPYGIQKKLEIVRALVATPELVLLDEPAAGLNPQETEELSGFIKTLPAKGFTVLLIEHDMSLVMGISDYVYVMDYGKKIAEGVPAEVQQNKLVIEAYIGKGGNKNAVES